MRDNIITAAASATGTVVTQSAYQYDYGLRLEVTGIELPAVTEWQFANSASGAAAKTTLGDSTGCDIPNDLLISGEHVYAWLFIHETTNDGFTVYTFDIPVIQRTRPVEEEPTPEQAGLISQAIAALNEAVEDTTDAKEAAETAATDAAASAVAAGNHADAAEAAEINAQNYATDAQGYANAASASAGDAEGFATAAATSETNAASSATSAADNATAAGLAKDSASASATSAAGYATSASASATTAGEKAVEASASATAAAGSATAASGSADDASDSAIVAAGAATDASASATTAAGSATSAANSATAAAGSATAAAQSAATAASTVSGAIGAIEAKGAEVIESIPEDYTELSADVTQLKSDLSYNNNLIYLGTDEITSITGRRIAIDNGHIVIGDNPSNFWKTLLVPVECLYIDGVASLKSGGLAGTESVNVPTMAFLDENYDVVGTPVYTAISAPHTFAESDVPTGAVYVAMCFSNTFVFAFKSINTKTKDNEQAINGINSAFEDAGKYNVELNFSSVTGYYNASKGYTTYEGVTVAEVSVNAEDIFYLTSRNYYGMARVAFMNESNTCIAVLYTGGNTTNMENTRFVVPSNAVTMLIQTVYGYACTLWKADIKERIDINDAETNAIKEATTDPLTTDVTLTYVSATGYYAKNKGFSTYEGVTTATITVSEGEKYLLTTRNYYNAAIACLLDSNDAVNTAIWVANNTAEVKSYKITIPSGISKLMIQRLYTYEPTNLKLITGIRAKNIQSILQGKRMTIIGDSITEKNSRAKTNWALWIKDWADPTIQNLGASGTGFIAGGNNPYSNRIASINNPDIIGVALSFNDMSQTIEDLTDAAEDFFDTLLESYPSTPIICYVQSPWSAYHYGVTTSDAWVSALKEICNTRGIPFYDDLYRGCTLKPWIASNRAIYYMNDGEGSTGEEDWVHPNSEGHKAIARYLYPRFVENLVTTGLDYMI